MNEDSADVWDVSGDCQSLSSISSKHLSTTPNGLMFHYIAVVFEPIREHRCVLCHFCKGQKFFSLSLQKLVQLNPRIIYCKNPIFREIPLLLREVPFYVSYYLLCFVFLLHI